MTIRLVHSSDSPLRAADRLVWRLVRAGRAAEARILRLGDRRELRISVDGDLVWSRVYERRLFVNLEDEAVDKRGDFEALGWQQA